MDVSTQTRCQVLRKHFSQQTRGEAGWDGQEERGEEEVERFERMSGKRIRQRLGGKKKKALTQNSDTQTQGAKSKGTQTFVWRLMNVDLEKRHQPSRGRVLEQITRHRQHEQICSEMALPKMVSPMSDDSPPSKPTKEEQIKQKREEEAEKRKRYKTEVEKTEEEWKTWKIGEFVWTNKKEGSENIERKEVIRKKNDAKKEEDNGRDKKQTTMRLLKKIGVQQKETINKKGTKPQEKEETNAKGRQITREGNNNEKLRKEADVIKNCSNHRYETLQDRKWINDEVINDYLVLIVEQNKDRKIHCMSSFFYEHLRIGGHISVKRWTRKTSLFTFDLILIPLHFGNHWCLATIDLEKKKPSASTTVCLERIKAVW
ncbi:ubiquitin-like-specific protease 1 [Venturia canescens]|uniref:ubiquitin-like-specific protease 1 n=1 Tax=Venturia canescens TaxID=32260 RepID=UPI001C9CD8B4|nr:ubiquitin-like-specific protease 1 [Venturia canescens]